MPTLNGKTYDLTDEETAVVEAMREEGANPYECIEALEERVEVLEGIVRNITLGGNGNEQEIS